LPLDLAALGPQVTRFAAHAHAQAPREATRLESALEILRQHAGRHLELADLAEERQTPFRAARPLERLDLRRPRAECPDDYAVVATDGSQIEPDRHGPVLCHLINVGSAVIRYGREASAQLSSQPKLRFAPEEVSIVRHGREPVLIQERLLGLIRHVSEMERLAELAEKVERDRPVVALQDGTLLLSSWGGGSDTQVREEIVEQFLNRLDRLKAAGVPLASYISRPRSSDVVNTLRLAHCPYGAAECESCGGDGDAETCLDLIDLPDRLVFAAMPLAEGERSARFASSWSTSAKQYREHQIQFFYLNVGSEIARVEVPEWVARDPASLDLVQSVIVDQVRRGQGYPRVLIEAHEKAVITAADRRILTTLIEQALAGAGVSAATSEKEASKRLRGL
jgi:GNAT superfamily N-acetyltransferase